VDALRQEKLYKVKRKFQKLDKSKQNLETSLVEFMSAKKEGNIYRMAMHEERMDRQKRIQSAKKETLLKKIM
jgi:hypothetical protein